MVIWKILIEDSGICFVRDLGLLSQGDPSWGGGCGKGAGHGLLSEGCEDALQLRTGPSIPHLSLLSLLDRHPDASTSLLPGFCLRGSFFWRQAGALEPLSSVLTSREPCPGSAPPTTHAQHSQLLRGQQTGPHNHWGDKGGANPSSCWTPSSIPAGHCRWVLAV